MENIIYEISGAHMKSLMLTNDEIWVSSGSHSTVEKLEKSANSTGLMQSGQKISLASIYQITFNERSSSVKFFFVNAKGKNDNLNIAFDSKERANEVANFIGNKLGLTRNVNEESKIKAMLPNALGLLIAIICTYAIGTVESADEINTDSVRGKNRLGASILRKLHETIGQTGILILGTLIVLYLAYTIYKRYNNPAKVITYSK